MSHIDSRVTSMSEVIITVRGEHATTVTAELGVPTVSVRLDGGDRADVVSRATALAGQISDELRTFAENGAANTWSSDRVSIWSDRPWNNEGAQLPLVYHATVTARAEFTDIAALSEWITALADRDGVTVDGIAWQLTPARTTAVESEVAQAAVGVAVARAGAYAAALGLAQVTPLSIADVGLLGSTGAPEAKMMRAAAPMMMADAAGSGGGLSLEPRQLRIASTVEARFSAQ